MAEYTKIGNDIDTHAPIDTFYDLIPYSEDNESFKHRWVSVSIKNSKTMELIDDEILTREDGAVSFSLPSSFIGTVELTADEWIGSIEIKSNEESEDIAQMIFVEMKKIGDRL